MHFQARPPIVTVTPTAIVIDSLFYGESYPINQIQKIELVPELPRIRLRTNGYAAGGTLRGWFRLDQLGSGKLFAEIRHPPFIVVHLTNGFVCVNYAEPAQTLGLFGELRQHFPGLVAEGH
jgi:hypothetical protein